MDIGRGISDVKSSSSEDDSGSSNSKKDGSKGIKRLMKRSWYVVVVAVVVLAGVVAWLAQQASVDAAWKKATDDYGRADYAAAAKLIGDMPVPTDEKRLTVYAQTMLATRQLDKALPAYKSLYDKKKILL